MAARFRDRSDAGRQLAARLTKHTHRPDVLILALPRGGVPVALRLPKRSTRHWMSSSCASWDCRASVSWPLVRSRAAEW
jgi:hypothetical protein